jgi:hypothetical protein
MIITFSSDAKVAILGFFGLSIDLDGYIIDKSAERVILKDGKPIKLEEFAGFYKNEHGHVTLLRSDLASLIEISDKLFEKRV